MVVSRNTNHGSCTDSIPEPTNEPLRDLKRHQKEAIRPFMEVHKVMYR